jgi:transcriptional regulator with XRE-family HTH domain
MRGRHDAFEKYQRSVTMAHSVDIHVGQRLKERRLILGLTQTDLAKRVDISFQQIQKYELGKNRVSASKLWGIAQILDVPVGYFFEGLTGSDVEGWSGPTPDVMADKDVIAMVRAFVAIPEAQRLSVLHLAKSLAQAPAD